MPTPKKLVWNYQVIQTTAKVAEYVRQSAGVEHTVSPQCIRLYRSTVKPWKEESFRLRLAGFRMMAERDAAQRAELERREAAKARLAAVSFGNIVCRIRSGSVPNSRRASERIAVTT